MSFKQALDDAGAAGAHRGAMITYDSDFGRFPGVSWRTPGS